MICLRQYQVDAINAVREAFKTHNSVCMVLPTGAGKTLTTGWMLARAAEKGARSIFCVHRIELMGQTSAAFKTLGINHGFIAAKEDYDPKIKTHIASIDTLRRRLDKIEQPDFLVIDEAQHAVSESWKSVINAFPNAKKLLITATPERLDGKGLKSVADTLVIGVRPRWLIDNGFLSQFRIWSTNIYPDLSGVRTTCGDYNAGDLAGAMNNSVITGNAIEHYKSHAEGKQAIVFAVNIEHSKQIAKEFNEAGIPAGHLDGGSEALYREDIVERFRYGELRVLCNVNLFTEGFDVPNADCCIMIRPTKSLSLFLQMTGRVLRPVEGKTAIILDHAGNTAVHGTPDLDRPWTLEGKTGRDIKKQPVAQCEKCFFMWEYKPSKQKICPECGHIHIPEKREIRLANGELREVDLTDNPWAWASTARLSKVMGQAKSMNDLHMIARARGYKAGWVFYKAKELGLARS